MFDSTNLIRNCTASENLPSGVQTRSSKVCFDWPLATQDVQVRQVRDRLLWSSVLSSNWSLWTLFKVEWYFCLSVCLSLHEAEAIEHNHISTACTGERFKTLLKKTYMQQLQIMAYCFSTARLLHVHVLGLYKQWLYKLTFRFNLWRFTHFGSDISLICVILHSLTQVLD